MNSLRNRMSKKDVITIWCKLFTAMRESLVEISTWSYFSISFCRIIILSCGKKMWISKFFKILSFRIKSASFLWSKTFTKHCTNNSLQSLDKIISSLLELIGYVLSISEYVLEKHLIAFDFDEKLMQSVTQVKITM